MSLWRNAWLAAALALLSGGAGAATYGFTGSVGGSDYPACIFGGWWVSGNTYSCSGAISLPVGDAILPASGITVFASGGITLLGGNTVGSSSVPVALEASWGAITATGGTVYGNLTSGNGAINLTGTSVTGSIATGGTVWLAGGGVSGNVTGNNGVTTTSGPVIGGNVSATSGAISLSLGSVAGSVHSNCCIVTTSGTNVGNGVSSGSHSVSITGGTIAGAISGAGLSGVSISGATVGSGSITAINAPLNISNSTIGSSSSNVNITGTNNVNLSGTTTVHGNVTAAGWPGSLAITSPGRVLGTCSPTHPLCQAISMAKTTSSSASAINSYISFEIAVTNETAGALSSVEITDVLPAGMNYSASSATLGSVTVSGQTVIWTIPSLPAGYSGTLTLVVRLTQSGSLTNTATSPGANPVSATVLVLPKAITTYRMDETAGSWNGTAGEVVDSGGNGLHGRRQQTATTTTNTESPDPTIASQYPSVSGGFCNAGRFDGNAVIEAARSTYFQFSQVMSASAWIYPTAYPTGGSDLYSILSNDVNYEFHLNQQGKLYWWWDYSTLTSAATIPLNQWTHVAITLDSTSANHRQRIYINGVLDANTNNWSGTLGTNDCPFYVGGDIDTNSGCTLISARNFRGMIDEASIYDYEMTAAAVQASMKLGRQCSGTFHHIEIVHDGSASVCASKTVTLKACLDAACTVLYPGAVSVQLSPTGWTPSDTVNFSGGVATATLANSAISAPSITLGTVSVTPAPSSTTVCYDGSTQNCTLNVVSSSCLADAVEVGAIPYTSLYTKLAATAFNIDLLAISSGAVNTLYTGTMTTDLVDADTGCAATSTALNTAQAVTFVAANMGRKTVSMTSPVAHRKAQVRIKIGSSYACSADRFAVRPTSLAVGSNMNADAAGANAAATPMLGAGNSFTLAATGVAGYNGTPTIDASKLAAHAGSVATGTLSGAFSAANAATGISSGAAFAYNEAGYIRFAPFGVIDASFTAIDQPSDCTDDFSNSAVGGRLGCKFGNTAFTSYFGRFIPHHFDTAVTQGCAAGAYTYSGQPFDLTVTARNSAGATTSNYVGAFAKTVALSDGNGVAGGALVPASVAAAEFNSGVANLTRGGATPPSFSFVRATPDSAPGTIKLRAVDADGVSSATGTEGTALIRIGRIRLSNVYGSMSPLNMPVEAQFWTGNSWVRNSDDSCTVIATANIWRSVAGWTRTVPGTLVGGAGTISLVPSAPGTATVCADLATDPAGGVVCSATSAALPWLQSRWPPGANYDNDPSATATFGVFSPESKRGVYNREMY